MSRRATSASKSVVQKKTAKSKTATPVSGMVLSSVMRFENPGQLTVPNCLNLGSDGKLYLSHSEETKQPKAKPQMISLKESVAWFRLGHDYNLNVTKEAGFAEWLKLVEKGIP